MSEQSFLSFLQQILTMVDPENKESVEQGKKALSAVIELARTSQKVHSITMRMMVMALHDYDFLVANADHFAGKPGQYMENEQKRRRLSNVIRPGC